MTMDIPGTCAFTRAFSASASILARIARSSGSFLSSVAATCCAIAAEPGQRQIIAISPANGTDRTFDILFMATPPTRTTSASIFRATVGSDTVRVISVSPSGFVLGALVGSPLAEACRPPSSGDCHIQFTLVALQTQFDLIAGFQADQTCDQLSPRLHGLLVDLEQSVPRLHDRFGRRAFRLHTVDDDGAGALLRAEVEPQVTLVIVPLRRRLLPGLVVLFDVGRPLADSDRN